MYVSVRVFARVCVDWFFAGVPQEVAGVPSKNGRQGAHPPEQAIRYLGQNAKADPEWRGGSVPGPGRVTFLVGQLLVLCMLQGSHGSGVGKRNGHQQMHDRNACVMRNGCVSSVPHKGLQRPAGSSTGSASTEGIQN